MENLSRLSSRTGDILNDAVDQLQIYGWYLFFGCTLLYFIYSRFLKHRLKAVLEAYDGHKKSREDREYSAKYHKNSDLYAARISAQQKHAQKLQEQYDQQAKEYQEKMQIREDKKRQEALDKLEGGSSGRRLGGKQEARPRTLRPDYNPLMGPGGSNYRPPKRGKCGGGGCGK
ncbi:selenoprotein S-like [Cylas formicarius]|uniref:selenoprotein S-like n=1 Tax=Cylas formicarius TaxID=197179 RepID=UPI0029585E10|nr:selenoprotein S-like [Cylas formicarius]XP_060525950.1 selenoprotein S-like [Cylas formicarius]XP_060525951.1 selenoprotein S-like [Cylas formicarius]XP_060525952.1 selenoprotein S-like [Cylas formicarius]